MARKKAEEVTVKANEYEVADKYKFHREFMVGTQFIPVVNGKVTVNEKMKEVLEKGGFLK